MKPCKPIYSHIDEDEIGTGRIITSSLLQRYCTNIAALKRDVEKLEDNTSPELKKTFHPPIIHDTHSYGVTLTTENSYEFDNSIKTTFIDGIGQKRITITDLEKKGNIYTKNLEYTDNITAVEDIQGNKYNKINNLTELENQDKSYFIDKDTQTLHIYDKDTIMGVYVTVATNASYIDMTNTTAHVNLEKHEIHGPYDPDQYEKEVMDQNTAMDENGNIRPVEMYWNFGWRRLTPFYTIIEALHDPLNENPTTPSIPTVARAFTITPGKTGLLTKIALLFKVKEGAEDEVYIEIRPLKGGVPSHEILAREKARIRGKTGANLHTIPFSTPPLVTENVEYAVVLRAGFTSSMKSYGIGGWSFNTYSNEALAKIGQWIKEKSTSTPSTESTRIFGFEEKTFRDIFHSINNTRTWTKAHSWALEGFVEAWFDSMRPRAFSYQTYIKPLKKNPQYQGKPSWVYWKPIHTNPIQKVELTPTTTTDNPNLGILWQVSVNMKDWYEIKTPEWTHNFTVSKEKERTDLYIRAMLASVPQGSARIQGLKATITTEPAKEAYLKTLFYNPRLSTFLGAHIWSKIGTNITKKPVTNNKSEIEIDIIRNIIQVDTFQLDGQKKEFNLSELPAQPLNNVIVTNKTGGNVLTRNRDYTVDYKNKKITLIEQVKESSGILRVEYHPLWIQGLKPEDFPLKTDLITEEFKPDNNKPLSVLQLKVVPLDPIRSIGKYNTTEEKWIELKEGEEYTVDYTQKEVKLLKTDTQQKYRVQYTPYLIDDGLALAYRMKREDLQHQIVIEDVYYQNRA